MCSWVPVVMFVISYKQIIVLHLTIAASKQWLNTKRADAFVTNKDWACELQHCLYFFFLCINDNYLWLSGADCPQLSAPADGSVEGYRRETGSTVRVSCDKGYKVHPDSSSFRSCQADKQWSGADPMCQRESYHIFLSFSLHKLFEKRQVVLAAAQISSVIYTLLQWNGHFKLKNKFCAGNVLTRIQNLRRLQRSITVKPAQSSKM